MPTKLTLLTELACGLPTLAAAHHSATIFDRQQVVAFQGTVTRFNWANPHVYIYVETPDEAGQLVEWEVETDATPILTCSGWSRDSFVPGEQISVRLNPDRKVTRKHGLLIAATTSDGATLSARSCFLRGTDDTDSLAHAENMAGSWELGVGDFEPYYAEWALVELTPKAIAAQAAYDIRTENPSAQCIAPPTPTILVAPYLNEIVLEDDRVLIRNERFNVERTIWLDGRGHPSGSERSNQGHSIGRWENGVLVVETTSFSFNRAPFFGRPARAEGVPAGLSKRVVERLRLSADRTHIVIDFELEDPECLAEPFVGTLNWYYAPHFECLGFDCDPDNARRFSGR